MPKKKSKKKKDGHGGALPVLMQEYVKEQRAENSAAAWDKNEMTDVGTASGGDICCMSIIGQVEGHYLLPSDNKTTKYEHLIPTLFSIECDDRIKGLVILINTVGGDVEAGLAIAELIAGMKTPTASVVLGGGHSIGVPLAVCADRSFIVPSATMTVHPVRMNGPVIGVPQTLSYFRRMQDRVDKFITGNSGVSDKKLKELMYATDEIVADVGTVIDGETAVKIGLIDEMGGLDKAVDWLRKRSKDK